MNRQVWIDGHQTDRMPERNADEFLRYARLMAVRHRQDENLHPFWLRVIQSEKRRCTVTADYQGGLYGYKTEAAERQAGIA